MLYTWLHTSPVLNIQDSLPPLVRRLDKDVVRELGALKIRKAEPPSCDDPDRYLAEQYALWSAWARQVDSELERLRAIRDQARRFSERYFNQLPGRGRDELLRRQLEAEATGRVAAWFDIRALQRGTLDFECYLERSNARQNDVIARIRTLLLAMEHLGSDLLDRANQPDSIAEALLSQASITRLMDVMTSREQPQLAWLALRAVQRPLVVGLSDENATWASPWLRALLQTNPGYTWLARTVAEVLAEVPDTGREWLFGRVTRRTAMRDDWHVRERCAALILTRYPEDTAELFDLLEADESTEEAIWLSVCETLAARTVESALPFVERLCNEGSTDRIRGKAALILVSWLESGRHDVVELIQNFVARESSATALRVVTAALNQSPDTKIKGSMVSIVDARMDASNAPMANALAPLRLRGDHQESAQALEAELAAMRPGDSQTVSADASTVFRAMASAATDGYGIYAKPLGPKRWRIRRGESYRTTLWRVLHEVRNPAPNKRQGYFHTRGRRYPGIIRAHPEHLGELTPTTVPGERRQISSEAGWGNYLPLVDDALDAMWKPIRIVSVSGVLALRGPATFRARFKSWTRLSWNYARLDQMRLAAIQGVDDQQRSRFLAHLHSDYAIESAFHPFSESTPANVMSILPTPVRNTIGSDPLLLGDGVVPVMGASVFQTFSDVTQSASQGLIRLGFELFERTGARVRDLAVVILALFVFFVGRMVIAREEIDRWRAAIPLSIGGWGTRGKSGTERLKAGLFHGLGFDVFVKTTGCEAMFIHAPRGADAREIFIYRPYDKASIWEQRDMLKMGYQMKTDVFLWECMALNPRYVTILQSHWMRDDLVTLTNAYPDHEDIQGPAGVDVAETIGRFIPKKKTVITAEREMLPVFQKLADDQQSRLEVVEEVEEFLLPAEVLERFPYAEHPRNIALVTRMAAEYDIDRDFCLFAMADKVVPDLGVLKVYPTVGIFGRDLTFINGMSANERAGFLNNWTRMNLDQIKPVDTPLRRVITVVNNRADRVARSIVFADILVRDVDVDRHVLIGTNLSGLRNYFTESLDRYLADAGNIVESTENGSVDQARRRLHALMARQRVFDFPLDTLVDEFTHMLGACGLDVPDHELSAITEKLRRQMVSTFSSYGSCVEAMLEPLGTFVAEYIDVDESSIDVANAGDFARHAAERIACAAAYRHLDELLDHTFQGKTSADEFNNTVQTVWRERFWTSVVSLDDAAMSGDAIILAIADSLPPGADVTVMGTQNIKGTGLDFVYRWVDLDATMQRVEAAFEADDDTLNDTLVWLASASRLGLTETVLARRRLQALADHRRLGVRDANMLERATQHMANLTAEAIEIAAGSTGTAQSARWSSALRAVEKWLDPLDAVRRRWESERYMRLLAAQRISHAKMALLMQKLTKRQKGGWLLAKKD